jgi:hypothetical protein
VPDNAARRTAAGAALDVYLMGVGLEGAEHSDSNRSELIADLLLASHDPQHVHDLADVLHRIRRSNDLG